MSMSLEAEDQSSPSATPSSSVTSALIEESVEKVWKYWLDSHCVSSQTDNGSENLLFYTPASNTKQTMGLSCILFHVRIIVNSMECKALLHLCTSLNVLWSQHRMSLKSRHELKIFCNFPLPISCISWMFVKIILKLLEYCELANLQVI